MDQSDKQLPLYIHPKHIFVSAHVEPESIWASAQICLAVWHVRLKSQVEDQSEKH